MSSITWTPTEVASKARLVARLQLWRAVEAQHQVSTTLLVDTLSEQAVLERLLEGSKPQLPGNAGRLHWLLFTPFRYPSLPNGSRFRSAADPGVFYGAEAIRTACAELGYWRWRFLRDSPSLDRIDAQPQTVFLSSVSGLAVDLREEPWTVAHAQWTAPQEYSACQAFARTAREAEIAFIRYESVRDPLQGSCAAVLHPNAFRQPEPLEAHTWLLTVTGSRVFWRKDSVLEDAAFEFTYD
ncbi:MAG TPA: RES family NAD+ phosphorylase [Burkholderiales bacterium]|nr:RES family NAD+ phosphorylase [Burkholderiales bacterium]